MGRHTTTTTAAMLVAATTGVSATAPGMMFSATVPSSSVRTSMVAGIGSLPLTRTLAVPRGGGGDKDDAHVESHRTTEEDPFRSTPSNPSRRKKKKTKKFSKKKPSNVARGKDGAVEAEGSVVEETDSETRSAEGEQERPKKEETGSFKKHDTPKSSTDTTDQKQRPKKKDNPIVQEILRQDDYYQILGLSKSSSLDSTAIQKAYRRRCVVTHPDKMDGDRRAFDKVSEAYNVLIDEDKRQIYDRFGKEGVKNQEQYGSAGMSSAEDMFRSFFGGSGRSPFSQGRQAPRRNRTVRYQLEVTLEDLYQGRVKSVLVAPPEPQNPFFPSRQRESSRSKRVEVHIPRGGQDGQAIVMSGEMDWDTDSAPGDLVFGLHTRPHKQFVRKGYDLAMTIELRCAEAVSGQFTRTITHLDGRELYIGMKHSQDIEDWDEGLTKKSSVTSIQPGQVQVIKGQGMPKDELGTSFGDLYVIYKVKLPEPRGSLTDDERAELKRLLDKLEGIDSAGETGLAPRHPVVDMEPAALSDFGVASGTPPPVTENDFEDGASDGFSPFGHAGRSSSFYFSSSGSNAGPFFGMRQGFGFDDGPHGEGSDENVQCRQM